MRAGPYQPACAEDHVHHPRLGHHAAVDLRGMGLHVGDIKPLLGAEVDIETTAGALHGTLLSYSSHSLWLVDGDADLMVPLAAVQAVTLPRSVR
jgi:hypothetical protein